MVSFSFDFGVLRRAFLGFFRTIIATDDDLLAGDLYLDAAILDFPIAHRALFRLHEWSPWKRVCEPPRTPRALLMTTR